MKDRRGTVTQGYLDQSDDGDFLKPIDGYAGPQPDAEGLGAAPKLAKTTLSQEAAPEEVDAGPLKGPSASEEVLSSSGAGSNGPGSDVGEDAAGNGIDGGLGQGTSAPVPTIDQPEVADGPVSVTPASYGGGSAGGGAGGGASPSEGGGFLGDAMGWDAAAFAEAGGFEAILTGQLPPGAYVDIEGQDIFVFVEELDLDIINNTLIQNTEINLIADDGSVIDIGGDFNAIQTQESLVVDGSGGPALPLPDAGPMPGDAPAPEPDLAMAC